MLQDRDTWLESDMGMLKEDLAELPNAGFLPLWRRLENAGLS